MSIHRNYSDIINTTMRLETLCKEAYNVMVQEEDNPTADSFKHIMRSRIPIMQELLAHTEYLDAIMKVLSKCEDSTAYDICSEILGISSWGVEDPNITFSFRSLFGLL